MKGSLSQHKIPQDQVLSTKEIYLPQRDKGLSLDREETDVAHRQMTVYKGKGETQC